MSYVEQVLGANESVILKAKVSLLAFVRDWVAIIICAILGVVSHFIFFVFAALFALHIFVIVTSTELALTDRKIVAKFGFIKRETIEIRLEKIESLRVSQGIFGRIFDFGTVLISSAGSTAPIPYIAAPIKFKKGVDEFLETKVAK